jgi:hypothetical protein
VDISRVRLQLQNEAFRVPHNAICEHHLLSPCQVIPCNLCTRDGEDTVAQDVDVRPGLQFRVLYGPRQYRLPRSAAVFLAAIPAKHNCKYWVVNKLEDDLIRSTAGRKLKALARARTHIYIYTHTC